MTARHNTSSLHDPMFLLQSSSSTLIDSSDEQSDSSANEEGDSSVELKEVEKGRICKERHHARFT